MGDAQRPSRHGVQVVVFWLVICLVVVLDQATKAAVREFFEDGVSLTTLVPGLLDLYLLFNTGAAFSVGEGAGIAFVLVAVVVTAIFGTFVWREKSLPLSVVVPMGCVAGGGLGNMLDRLTAGAVTDFLSFHFWPSFPVFNVADVFVTCGVVVLVVAYLRWDAGRAEDES